MFILCIGLAACSAPIPPEQKADWERDSLQAIRWERQAESLYDSAHIDSATRLFHKAQAVWEAYEKPWEKARVDMKLEIVDQDPASSEDQISRGKEILRMKPRIRSDSSILFEACITVAQALRRGGQMDSAAAYLTKGATYISPIKDSTSQDHTLTHIISWIVLYQSSGNAAAMKPYFDQLRQFSSPEFPLSLSNRMESNLITAVYYLNNSSLDSAEFYVKRAENVIRETLSAKHPLLAMILSWQSYVFNLQGNYEAGLNNNLELIE
ncbi:MAG: hypothetical protein AAFV07_01675, partial [Bacteroidota bacterium]